MKVATYRADGTSGEERLLPRTPFDGTVNEDALHQVVTALLAGKPKAALPNVRDNDGRTHCTTQRQDRS